MRPQTDAIVNSDNKEECGRRASEPISMNKAVPLDVTRPVRCRSIVGQLPVIIPQLPVNLLVKL
jgi:hypothetical protein